MLRLREDLKEAEGSQISVQNDTLHCGSHSLEKESILIYLRSR
jgi:hypothetical protein